MAAPQFASPEPIRFSEEEKDKILDLVGDLYDDGLQAVSYTHLTLPTIYSV